MRIEVSIQSLSIQNTPFTIELGGEMVSQKILPKRQVMDSFSIEIFKKISANDEVARNSVTYVIDVT